MESQLLLKSLEHSLNLVQFFVYLFIVLLGLVQRRHNTLMTFLERFTEHETLLSLLFKHNCVVS